MKRHFNSCYISKLLIVFIIPVFNVKTLLAQSDDCEKIRVGIYFVEVTDIVFDHLSKKYGVKSKQEWIDEVDSKMLEILRTNSPEIDFFSRRKNKEKDPHYTFQYYLHLAPLEQDLLIPYYDKTFVDPISGYEVTEYIDPVYSQGTSFYAGASIVINSPCIPNRRELVAVKHAEDFELDQVFLELSRKFWRVINLIEESERRRPVPARGPELEISYEKEYLSLLTEEDRQMKVIARVKNCKGEYLYRKDDSQPVYFPKEVNRCKYKQVRDCIQAGSYDGRDIVLTNPQYEAKGIYIVQNGLQASVEKVPLGSCGIGSNSEIHKDGELIIRGLEVEVRPDRKEIFVDEGTEITIRLNETDPDGNKYPVGGKDIDVYVSGVVNGKITPQGPYTSNENGEVLLMYQAGDGDSRIDLTASFQPPNYPDKAEDHASITVNPMKYDATIFLKKKVIKRKFAHQEKRYQRSPCNIHEKDGLEFTETIEASVYVTLRSVMSVDMPAFNQRWETYEVTSIHLSDFSLFSGEKTTIYHNSSGMNCAGGGIEQITTKNKSLTDRTIDQRSKGSTMVVAFDIFSEKAALILPFGAGVGYEYDESAVRNVTTWDDKGKIKKERHTDTRHEENGFNVEAVEDEQPYSTAKSRSEQLEDYVKSITGEEIKLNITALVPESEERISQEKIHPDLIVQFGDGVNYFGGRGNKVINEPIDGGFSYEEQNFLWQMTRKKKNEK